MQDPALGDEGGHVEEGLSRLRPVALDVAHDDADPLRDTGLHAPQRLQVLLDEQIMLQQVHRGIAAEAHLGEDGERAPGGAGLLRHGQDLLTVAREVSDRGVDLRAGDLHFGLLCRRIYQGMAAADNTGDGGGIRGIRGGVAFDPGSARGLL